MMFKFSKKSLLSQLFKIFQKRLVRKSLLINRCLINRLSVNQHTYVCNSYLLIQFQFVRKVYATLLSQLLITIGFIAVFVFVKPIKEFYCDGVRVDENGLGHCIQRSTNGFIMYIVSYVIFFITYIAIACCESVRRKSPGNMIAMAIFTLSLSVWVGLLFDRDYTLWS